MSLSLDAEDFDERADDARVEMRSGARAELGRGLFCRARLPIRAVGRHGAPRVARAHDARGERDRLAGERIRIALAVPPLVARPDDCPDLAEEPTDALEHLLAEHGVRLHQLPLGVVERARLVDD